MRACALAVLALCLVPVAAHRSVASEHIEVVEEQSALVESTAKHAHDLLNRFAKKQKINMTLSDVEKTLEGDKLLTSYLQEHMRAEAAGEMTNNILRNDMRKKLLSRASYALHTSGESLDQSTGGKTQCMCALQHYNGYEMVDLETKQDYTQGFLGDYQNGKVACAYSRANTMFGPMNDCIYRCHSHPKYGLDSQEGAMLGVDRPLPFGQQFTASRCNMDGRCECMDVSETTRKVRDLFGGRADLINDHPFQSQYDTPEECLTSCDCADGGGVDQEGLCIDEFNPALQPSAYQYQWQTAPAFSFEQ